MTTFGIVGILKSKKENLLNQKRLKLKMTNKFISNKEKTGLEPKQARYYWIVLCIDYDSEIAFVQKIHENFNFFLMENFDKNG